MQAGVRTVRVKVAAQGSGFAAEAQARDLVFGGCGTVHAQQISQPADAHFGREFAIRATLFGCQLNHCTAAAGHHDGISAIVDQGAQLGGHIEPRLLQADAHAAWPLQVGLDHGVNQGLVADAADAAEHNRIALGKHPRGDQRADLVDIGRCRAPQRQSALHRQIDIAQRQAARSGVHQIERHAQGLVAFTENAVAQHQGRGFVGVDRDSTCHMHQGCRRHWRLMAHQVQVHAQVVDLKFQVVGQAQHQVYTADRAGHGQPLGVFVSRFAVEDGQAKLHIAHAQALGIGVDFAGLKLAVAIGVRAIRAQAHKACQACAAQTEHLGLHLSAIGQVHVLRAALQAHGPRELEEVTDAHVHAAAGAHQLAGFTGHVEGDGLVSAGQHLEVFFACSEVDHFGVGIELGVDAADQVDVHRQVARGQAHIVHAHKGHAARLGLQGRPLQALPDFSARSRIGQHQSKAHFAHRHAHRFGVGFGFCEHTIAIAVLPVRAIDTCKSTQVLSTKTQRIHVEFGAVGQGHGAGGLFKAQIARDREEAVHFHLQVARGTHQRALAALEVQRHELVGRAIGQLAAGGHPHRGAVVYHRAIAAHVDVELQVFGANVHQGQAHLGGLGRCGRQAQPAACRLVGQWVAVLEQSQAQVQARELKACGAGIRGFVQQAAVVVAVQTVGAVQTHKRIEIVAANHPAVRLDGAALGHADVFEAGRQGEAAIHRQKVRRLHRHAGGVGLALAKVRRVEEVAQRVLVGRAVRRDAQRVGCWAFDHLQAQARFSFAVLVNDGCQLQQQAAIVKP